MNRFIIGRNVILIAMRSIHNESSVPRPTDDRRKVVFQETEYGYFWNYQNKEGRLPRSNKLHKRVRGDKFQFTDKWSKDEALMGVNDYIDLLGDGTKHPVQYLSHIPDWLRGFPGQKRANELIRILHYRNLYGEQLKRNAPKRYHELYKRINHLLRYHNYKKSDEIREARKLGIWDDEGQPDWYFKEDKHKKWFKTYEDYYY